jgi:proteasome lid subunit RPN8/RPN11
MLQIPRPLVTQLIAHLQSVYPEEGCGLLAGSNGQVSQQYPIENILHSQTAYEMDALQQVNTMLAIEARDEALLAIYHSHPNSPAFPSETDIALAYYPEALSLIVSLTDRAAPIIRAFQIKDGLVFEVPLIIE